MSLPDFEKTNYFSLSALQNVKRDFSTKIIQLQKTAQKGVSPLLQSEWESSITGKTILSCGFGGTNWEVGTLKKNEKGELETRTLHKIEIPDEAKQLTFQEFINSLAIEISQVINSQKLQIDTLAMALGFPIKSLPVKYGIEAQFITKNFTKGWKITDTEIAEKSFIGQELIKALFSFEITLIKKIFILNDVSAITNTVTKDSLPLGFIFGTGVNIGFKEYNLEPKKEKIEITDPLGEQMVNRGLISQNEKGTLESFVGGNNLKYRLAIAAAMLGYDDLFEKIIDSQEPSIVSLIAQANISDNDRELLEYFDLNSEELKRIKGVAEQILISAGKVISTLIAATVESYGDTSNEFSLPIEGSVFWEGYRVKEIVEETIKELLPDKKITFIKSSSLVGVGQLALCRS